MRVEKYAEGLCEFLTIDEERYMCIRALRMVTFYRITDNGFECCSQEEAQKFHEACCEQLGD